MGYGTRVDETWRHRAIENGTRDDETVFGNATLAASSHNTQPWLFKREKGAIYILPDLNRRCPAVDPDDHHLYAGLGCAAENLLIAARAAGLSGCCIYDAAFSGVRIEFEAATPVRGIRRPGVTRPNSAIPSGSGNSWPGFASTAARPPVRGTVCTGR